MRATNSGAMGSQEGGADFTTPSMAELLRISLKLSDKERMHEEALKGTKLKVSPEDQAWLKEAMGMNQKSDAERMKEALVIVNDASESQAHKEYALDFILFAIEDIDNACDFVRFDGALATLLRLLEDDNTTMRLGAAWLLGTLAQNNPKVQKAILGARAEIVAQLITLTLNDPEVEVQRKAMLAVSALVRNCEAGQAAFLAAGGPTLPAELLGAGAPDVALQKRSLHLASHLIGESPAQFLSPIRGTKIASLCSRVIGASSSGDIESEDLDLREQALRLLLSFASASAEELQAECGDSLRAAVTARAAQVAALEGDEKEWRETEVAMGKELIAALPSS